MKTIGLISTGLRNSHFNNIVNHNNDQNNVYSVYNRVKDVKDLDEIYVITDDPKIASSCTDYNIPCICEPIKPMTAVERMANQLDDLEADLFIRIPIDDSINIMWITQVVNELKNNYINGCVGLKTLIKNKDEFKSSKTIKVITDSKDYAMYLSRSPIPYVYDNHAFKDSEIYGFRKEFLEIMKLLNKKSIEKVEPEITLLRYLEHGYKIKYLIGN